MGDRESSLSQEDMLFKRDYASDDGRKKKLVVVKKVDTILPDILMYTFGGCI